MAAVIGKYIHPDDVLSDERKKLKNRIQHPHQVDGKGRDALIYTYEPSVSAEDVDNTFYELQKKHREVQAQLNSMKHDCGGLFLLWMGWQVLAFDIVIVIVSIYCV